MLIRTRTPLDGVYQTHPDTLHEFCLGQGVFLLLRLDRRHDLAKNKTRGQSQKKNRSRENFSHIRVRIAVLQAFPYGFDDFLLEDSVLLLRPPIRDLSQSLLSKKLVKNLIIPFVRREKQQEVFDPTLLEITREVVD